MATMTTFKIANDDIGVRGLREGNKTPVITGPLQPVKACNPVQKSPENLPLRTQAKQRTNFEPPHPHRRHADRRKTNQEVLLDTRSSHDRRTKTDKTDEDAMKTVHGIDKIV